MMKHKGKLIAVGLLVVLLLILVLIYDLLALLFSDFGATVICLFAVFQLIRFVSVLSTFPGCFWFYRRKLQMDFNRDYCQRLHQSTERVVKFFQTDFEHA